jgi:hypothetical protein
MSVKYESDEDAMYRHLDHLHDQLRRLVAEVRLLQAILVAVAAGWVLGTIALWIFR